MTDGGALFAGMSSLVLIVTIFAITGILLAIGIGYWCMKVFESKGRPGGTGFLMGFALTFFLHVAGAVAAVVIAYCWDASASPFAPAAPRLPPPAPPLSPDALTVATFNSATGWSGRCIVHDRGLLQIEGVCTVLPAHVLTYARRGEITWASDALRGWIEEWAAGG